MAVKRFFSHMIDVLICGAPTFLIVILTHSINMWIFVFSLFLEVLVFIFIPKLLGWKTIGMMITKLQLIRVEKRDMSVFILVARCLLLSGPYYFEFCSKLLGKTEFVMLFRGMGASFFLVGAFPLFKGRYLTIWDQITQTTVISIEDENKEMPKPYWRYTKFLIIFIGLTVIFYLLKTP